MEPETSQFESSEMLATYLASTPLLEESWRMCSQANEKAQLNFTVNRVGKVVYVAFSGVQAVECSEETCRNLVELKDHAKGIFGGFSARFEGAEEPVKVHCGLLRLFLYYYYTPNFQYKMHEIINESKSVVFTGHSLGGAVASLSALWLLSTIDTSTSIDVLCITYGSPLLGNPSFSRSILQERWGGNFCHIVAQYDIVPRLLFAPATPFVDELVALFKFWQFSMATPSVMQLASQVPYEQVASLFVTVLECMKERLGGDENQRGNSFWPFGSYMFCTEKGAICMDNEMAIVRFLYFMLAQGSASWIEDHLKYADYIREICWQYLRGRDVTDVRLLESNSEAGIALALKSAGLAYQDPVYGIAKYTLTTARQVGYRRAINTAQMAVSLSKINPLRAQIDRYKAFCDASDEQLGYYDEFKRRGASRRGTRVNYNRIRLGQFWDEVIQKLETNQLTHDFHKLPKYVNASNFYKLLVEPLEIAEYYRTGMHKKKGHYIEHGRERRFEIFDKWWKDRKVGDEESNPRSTFASLTQDSCFWARVEEARDSIYHIIGEMDSRRHSVLLDKIEKFEQYASKMIERKEVSLDVLAKNSSYNLFLDEWKELKSRLQLLPPRFPASQDAMVPEIAFEAESSLLLAFHERKLVS